MSAKPSVTTEGAPVFFFEDQNIDHLFSMTMALGAEITALSDKLDTVLRLLDQKAVLPLSEVADFTPDATAQAERDAARETFIKTLLMPFSQEADRLAALAQAKRGRK